MSSTTHFLISVVAQLVHSPSSMITRLADDVDEVWEPFLRGAASVSLRMDGGPMAIVSRETNASIDVVFATLVDPTTYPHWLVGARDIRDIDDDWPRPGAAFHHRVGLVGPLKIADLSKVVEVHPPGLLTLEVRARPLGRGLASFRLREVPADPGRCVVELDEVPLGRLARLQPVLDPITARRNRRSLAQLEDFIVHDSSHRAPG